MVAAGGRDARAPKPSALLQLIAVPLTPRELHSNLQRAGWQVLGLRYMHMTIHSYVSTALRDMRTPRQQAAFLGMAA